MDRDELEHLAGNPNHIPGIYNYCDRWCERCPLTRRCLNFAMEQVEDERDPASRDPENQAFWGRISENFKLAFEMLQDMAEEQGIDLDAVQQEELDDIEQEEEQLELESRKHPIAVHAMRYSEMADEWLDASANAFEEKGQEFSKQVELELPGKEPHFNLVDLTDSVEVIRWYQHFIYVKMMRALGGKNSGDELAEKYDFPKDSDGSAKIALIAVDRSIGAWTSLRKHLSNESDRILDILVFLNRLRKLIENEFPDARSFQRPGFDYFPEPGEE